VKIKLFEEYKINRDEDIGDEYAKMIISKSIDDENDGKTLEDTFYEIGKSELEDGEHDEAVIYSIIDYLEKKLFEAKNLKTISEIRIDRETQKFNL